jgi:succinate dehydrogenase / fumarate reductase flavoprotein subunit
MHGSNRLGGNSLSDLLVFGARAGAAAAAHATKGRVAEPTEEQVAEATAAALAPFARTGEPAYAVHADLQEAMNELVGIIRKAEEVEEALRRIDALKERARSVRAEGGRAYNPGWHLALDLTAMLRVSEAIAKAALERTESRGGHTRDDYPATSKEWGAVNLICSLSGDTVELRHQPLPEMPEDLSKFFTDPTAIAAAGGTA